MTINDITSCPHCKSTFGYYQKVRYKGYFNDNTLFEDRNPYNHDMWDGAIETYRSKYYYCMECNERICKSEHE
jgi:hypothetical protein